MYLSSTNFLIIFGTIILSFLQPLKAQQITITDSIAAADFTLAEQASKARSTGKNPEVLAQFEARKNSMNESLKWFISKGRIDESLRFSLALYSYWLKEGRLDEGRKLIEEALQLPDPNSLKALRSKVYYYAGLIAFRQKDQEATRKFNLESLQLAKELNDTSAIARALVGLTRVEFRAGQYDSMRKHAEEALNLLRKAGKENEISSPLHMLAAVDRVTGKNDEASKLYEYSMEDGRLKGNKDRVAQEQANLGYVRLHQGKPEEAHSLFNKAFAFYKEINDKTNLEFMLAAYAALDAEAGQSLSAAKLYGASLNLLSAAGITFDPDDQYELDRYSKMAKKQLGSKSYEKAMREGKKLTLDEALKLIDSK